MGVVYQLIVSRSHADAFLDNAFDIFGGFAIDASAATNVTSIPDLITLGGGRVAGAPYRDDEPVYILRVPINPFIRARRAVAPLNPDAFLGGITETGSFDGTGTVSAGGVVTDLLWIEPTRLSIGSELWLVSPDDPEPELVAIYHGVAWGWENKAAGTFKVATPSQFVGPVVRRPWGLVPVDVETSTTSDLPTAVTLVAPANPPEEEGFERLTSGMWAKRIAYHADLDLFESQVVGRYKSTPVRLLRILKGDDEAATRLRRDDSELQAHVTPLIVDTPLAESLGFERFTQGVYTGIIPLHRLSEQAVRESHPNSWNMSKKGAATVTPARRRNNSDNQGLLTDIVALLSNVAPAGWTQMTMVIQLVDRHVHYAAFAEIPDPDASRTAGSGTTPPGGSASGAGAGSAFGIGKGKHAAWSGAVKRVGIEHIPTAVMHYADQLKSNVSRTGEGAPFSLTLEFGATGRANVTANFMNEPRWADAIPVDAWRSELEKFPRDDEYVPGWLRERLR
ncbi:hypothetical protein I6E29_09410 [Arcanobacterium haemolyticum]|nr:hypothetical protein [Arcanobacterium haemolyticum]